MTFANTEMKQFKDLTPEQRSEIVEAWLKGNAEFSPNSTLIPVWSKKESWAELIPESIYRVKPSPKLDVPWHLFKQEWKWAAKDYDDQIYIFTSEPECGYSGWDSFGNSSKISSINHDFEPDGEVDWKQSLIERPIGV